MTTPKQLQAWREEFEASPSSLIGFTPEFLEREPDCEYVNMYVESEWQGYLRRCQETEQAIKESRKQALEDAIAICNSVCSPYPTDAGDGYNEGALDCEKKIKGLLI